MNKPVSLIEFILEEERGFKNAKGNFTLLLTQLEYATKIIAAHVKKAGLVDILGATGDKNQSLDEVQKMDVFANQLILEVLASTKQVAIAASEEMEQEVNLTKNGEYIVFFDPLDGSSNTDVNVSIGTIFSIYHKSYSVLQPGTKQVAAGYVLYGSSDMFVYTVGNGVNGFTLDPSIGSFLLSHPNIKIPQKGSIYSINEANSLYYDRNLLGYIRLLKTKEYKARYIGSLVADVHRTLLKGGIFLYPADNKNTSGKLRLMYEVNPISFIIQQAGGKSIGINNKDPRLLIPLSLHQKTPVILGSPHEINQYLKY